MSRLYDNIQRAASLSLYHNCSIWSHYFRYKLACSNEAGRSSSICIRHKLMQLRFYMGSVYFRKSCSNSFQVKTLPASVKCPKMISFWTGIYDTFSYMFYMILDYNPLTTLFQVVPLVTSMTTYQAEVIADRGKLHHHRPQPAQ